MSIEPCNFSHAIAEITIANIKHSVKQTSISKLYIFECTQARFPDTERTLHTTIETTSSIVSLS